MFSPDLNKNVSWVTWICATPSLPIPQSQGRCLGRINLIRRESCQLSLEPSPELPPPPQRALWGRFTQLLLRAAPDGSRTTSRCPLPPAAHPSSDPRPAFPSQCLQCPGPRLGSVPRCHRAAVSIAHPKLRTGRHHVPAALRFPRK